MGGSNTTGTTGQDWQRQLDSADPTTLAQITRTVLGKIGRMNVDSPSKDVFAREIGKNPDALAGIERLRELTGELTG